MRYYAPQIAVLSIVGLLAVSCSGSEPGAVERDDATPGTEESTREIVIGLQAPLSGFAASDGASAEAGAEIAIEYVNQEGLLPGATLSLVTADDQAAADQGPTVAERLMSDGAAAVVGASYSGPLRAAAPVYQENDVPMITAYAVHPEITAAGDQMFRIWPVADVEGEAVATYARDELGLDSVAVLNLSNDFGTSLAEGFTDAFTEAGGTVPVTRQGEIGQTDFRAALTEINAAEPDGVFVAAYYTEGAQIVQQADDIGLEGEILGAGMDSPQFLELAGAAANGMTFLSTFDPNADAATTRHLVTEYRERTDAEPDSIVAATFDSILIIADALRRADEAGQSLAEAIAATDLTGSTGQLSFTDAREVSTNIFFHTVQDGVIETVGEIQVGEEG